jgi:hypothetical protein
MMRRVATSLLCLVIVFAVPVTAGAQTPGYNAPLLAYQSPDRMFELSIGMWVGSGRWRFVGPVDVAATNALLLLDFRYQIRPGWTLAFDYAGGAWQGITFNGDPAPPTVSGNVTISSLDLRYRWGSGQLPVDLILGWQYYRARTDDSVAVTSDEARAGGLRFGAETVLPLRGPWSVRAMLAFAPALRVTEVFTAGGVPTTTTYNGSLLDGQIAFRYTSSPRFVAEAGYRSQRIDFRRPTDILEHTLQGLFVHFVYTP